MLWPPLLRYNRKRGDETRGWIPDPNDWGHTKYDNDTFKISWNKAWKKERELTDPNNLSAGEKLLIVEAKGRMEFMRSVIKKYDESQNQVYYTTDEIKIKNRKKKRSIS